MLAEERWNEILALVDKQKTVTVPELTALLHTSESTIRRDLVQLDRLQKLVKVHGGATSLKTQYVMSDETVSEKYMVHSGEKQKIAEYAARLVGPGDFVYIDSGTTTERLADCLAEKGATYVTNSITVARKLLTKGCRVILPGGEIKNSTEALVGAETIASISKYHFTVGFFGTNGVTDRTGFTTPEAGEAAVKRRAMEQTERRFVLCDSSKFSRVSPVTFANFDFAEIITDSIPDRRYRKYSNITEVGEA